LKTENVGNDQLGGGLHSRVKLTSRRGICSNKRAGTADFIHHSRFVAPQSLALLLLLLAPALPAHDSPEHVIEALTIRMEADGKQPDLLWERATEYRALGDLAAAASDLEQAVKARPDFVIAWQDLARIELARGNTKRASRTINRALRLATDEAGRAPSRMLRADIFCARGEFAKALQDCDVALQHATGAELDWYLTRAEIQRRLGKFEAAASGLKQAFDRSGSAVLEAEWIDALIDAGRYAQALEKIEPRLAQVRCQSSWLLRRARVRLARGDTRAAHQDLRSAISELSLRLGGAMPVPSLLADRGYAYALLGDAVLARRDLEAARKCGAEDSMLRRVEAALADRG
jgi:tetratricopeptide (TPR) repeat protein